VNNGRGGRQGFCLSPILLVAYSLYQLDLYREYVTMGSVEGVGDFKTGGQVIRTVKYADGRVLMAVEETVLQGPLIH
jgi:hypothetical protein